MAVWVGHHLTPRKNDGNTCINIFLKVQTPQVYITYTCMSVRTTCPQSGFQHIRTSTVDPKRHRFKSHLLLHKVQCFLYLLPLGDQPKLKGLGGRNLPFYQLVPPSAASWFYSYLAFFLSVYWNVCEGLGWRSSWHAWLVGIAGLFTSSLQKELKRCQYYRQ